MHELASNRADIGFSNITEVRQFNTQNPTQKLKVVPMPHPTRVFGNTFGVATSEQKLLNMLNTGLTNLIDNGTIDRHYKAYHSKGGDIFTPVTPTYQQPTY